MRLVQGDYHDSEMGQNLDKKYPHLVSFPDPILWGLKVTINKIREYILIRDWQIFAKKKFRECIYKPGRDWYSLKIFSRVFIFAERTINIKIFANIYLCPGSDWQIFTKFTINFATKVANIYFVPRK